MDFNWLWIVPVLGVLVIVHELGHFMTALWFKIRVEEFGIGFPPRAFGIRYKDIDFTINWLPIGGFVKIVGENGDSDDPRSFGRAAAWKRIIVLAAGSTMNLLLALFIFAGMAVAGTREVAAPRTGVSGFSPYLSTQEVKLAAGDRIISVAGVPVDSSEEARAQSLQHSGQPTEYVIERNGGESETLTLTPQVPTR